MRLEDVDQGPRAASGSDPWARAGRGYVCVEASPGGPSRRWRPALMAGPGVEDFIEPYFLWPAPLPWSGTVFATDAVMVADGLARVGDSILLGRGLMYPAECFPYAENQLDAAQAADGTWDIRLPAREDHLDGVTLNLTSPGLAIYGHWLVDAMPRLHRALASGTRFDRLAIPGPATPWKAAILMALGVDASCVVYTECLNRTYRCDRMILPTFDRFNSEVKPALMDVHAILRRALGSEAGPRRNLFVSRAGWGGVRRLVEREAIERSFADHGFELVRPETMAFADQVALFSQAGVVVGECGSGLHNAVFCPPGTRVGVLQSFSNPNVLQAQLAMVADQEVWFLIGRPVPDIPPVEAFSIDERSARQFARRILRGRPC